MTDGPQPDRRTGHVFATPGGFAFLTVGGLPAGRATVREGIFFRVLRAFIKHRPHHFGDHVASAAHHDRIAHAHVAAAYLVLIVQGRTGDHNAAHGYGLKHSHRGQHACAAHLDFNILQKSLRLLGGKLEGNGKARRARREAKGLLGLKIVQLCHCAVNLHPELRPVLPDPLGIVFHSLDALAQFAVGRGEKAVFPESGHGFRLQRTGRGWLPLSLAKAVRQKTQGPRSGDGDIKLAQGSGGGIAGIGKGFQPQGLLLFVEGGKILFVHDNLATHLQPGRKRPRPRKAQRHSADGAHGLGNHFAYFAVASSEGLLHDAVNIDDFQSQPVKLGVAPEA